MLPDPSLTFSSLQAISEQSTQSVAFAIAWTLGLFIAATTLGCGGGVAPALSAGLLADSGCCPCSAVGCEAALFIDTAPLPIARRPATIPVVPFTRVSAALACDGDKPICCQRNRGQSALSLGDMDFLGLPILAGPARRPIWFSIAARKRYEP